jgi:hypothetical protein
MRTCIQTRMEEQFPDNAHPLPIATAWDGTDWTVDLSARNWSGMDLEASATDPSCEKAEDKAFQRLTKSFTMFKKYGYVPN